MDATDGAGEEIDATPHDAAGTCEEDQPEGEFVCQSRCMGPPQLWKFQFLFENSGVGGSRALDLSDVFENGGVSPPPP